MLVETEKSSRLAAMRAKAERAGQAKKPDREFAVGLKSENKRALLQAINLIEQSMSEILADYPTAKKNTFFKLKYGIKVDKINRMPIKQVFHLLHLKPTGIDDFRLIENLTLRGETTGS